MRKKLTQLLRMVNIREEEIKLYLLLLKLQRATIPELILKSNSSSITVYRIMKRLVEKGLVDMKPVNNKQYLYQALSLQTLINKIHKQQRQMSRLAYALQGLDPLLPFIDIDENNQDESIEVKEGSEACREEYLKMPSECKDEYLHIGNMHNLWKVADLTYDCPEERNFIHQRLAKGIYCRIFNTASKEAEEFLKRDSQEKRTTRLKEKLPVTDNYLGIAENHSVLFICDSANPKAIVVRQPELIQLQKSQFQIMWDK